MITNHNKFFRLINFVSSTTKSINRPFLLLFSMSMVNFLFMHYIIVWICGVEIGLYNVSFFDNFLFTFIDTAIIYFFSLLISFKKTKLSLLLTFFITWILSFCNVFYARFFGQYLSFSSIGQAGNLCNNTVFQSMMAGFEYYDLFYPIFLFLFLWIYFKKRNCDFMKNCFRTIVISLTTIITIVSLMHCSLLFSKSYFTTKNIIKKTILLPIDYNILLPNWASFHKGLFRTFIIENYRYYNRIASLNDDQIKKIEDEYQDHSLRVSNQAFDNNKKKNIIFIIVESYLSVTSDLVIDGKEITPFLNKLKRDSNVYYNGHMQPNVTIGESSDGQFIYMTGLLPLKSEITIGRAKDCTFIGIPQLLRDIGYCDHSQIIVPTPPSIWEQKAMNQVYGINHMFSRTDYYEGKEDKGDLSDDMIFSFASKIDNTIKSPFFSMILTLSMHQPYNKLIDEDFIIHDNSLPQNYLNYLNACHFFDEQIHLYFENLKRLKLYENSLIIITSDHNVHLKDIEMEGKISIDLPLYIINGDFDISKAWSGNCNQLDVYTTLLDILKIKSEWRGFGHTLLNEHYVNSVSKKTKKLSEEIIYGNYFKKTTDAIKSH